LKLSPSLSLIAVGWAGFIVLTVRRLWLSPSDPTEARHYKEVKLFGVFVTTVCALLVPTVIVFPAMPYWQEAVLLAVLGFPLYLRAGFLGFRLFHSIVDERR
jgi:hypothetical protein